MASLWLRLKYAGKVVAKGIPNIYGVSDWMTRSGVFDWDPTKAQQMEKFRSWVYACIDARAKEVMNAQWQVLAKTGTGDFAPVPLTHPLVELLSDPNPFWTREELFYLTVTHMDLTGNAYWYTPRDGLNVPREIWLLRPDKVRIVPSKTDYISHYELRDGTQTIRFELDEIVHLRYPHPVDMYYGMAPLTAAMLAVEINEKQFEYQRDFYNNFAVPDFALVTEGTLDEATYKRMRADWNKAYDGRSRNKVGILEGGLDVKRIGVNPKELNWLADNKATMQTICGIFRVPPSKLGQEDVPNRAVAEASEYSFAKNVIEPICTLIDARVTQDLASEIDSRLVVKHVSTVNDDKERTARINQTLITSGQMTINEARSILGLDPMVEEGGDQHFLPSNYTAVESLVPDEDEDEPESPPAVPVPEDDEEQPTDEE